VTPNSSSKTTRLRLTPDESARRRQQRQNQRRRIQRRTRREVLESAARALVQLAGVTSQLDSAVGTLLPRESLRARLAEIRLARRTRFLNSRITSLLSLLALSRHRESLLRSTLFQLRHAQP
jgi:hypothetical protein